MVLTAAPCVRHFSPRTSLQGGFTNNRGGDSETKFSRRLRPASTVVISKIPRGRNQSRQRRIVRPHRLTSEKVWGRHAPELELWADSLRERFLGEIAKGKRVQESRFRSGCTPK